MDLIDISADALEVTHKNCGNLNSKARIIKNDFLNNINKKASNEVSDFSAYQTGTRVYHKKFGEGTINYVEPEGADLKVDINFDKVGHKRLMAKFANLEVID